MHLTCPTCAERFPLAAGLADEDGKRLAALFAIMEPVLGRAVISYLRCFKPPRQALRTARAVRVVAELQALVETGDVCRDERGGVRRPATPALWAAGIEQLLAAPGKLNLPLANHHYLRAIVYGLADQADAAHERQREADRRVGNHLQRVGPSPAKPGEDVLTNRRRWLAQQLSYGAMDQATYEAELAKCAR